MTGNRSSARSCPVLGSRGGAGRSRRAADGFNLVILVIFVAVLNIAVAAVLPHWSHLMQRDREQELIFRGLQYAEAIRVFQVRFGRYPVTLEELIEVNPRSIRRLWEDPMNPEGKWGLLFVDQQTLGQPGVGDDEADEDEADEGGRSSDTRRRNRPRRPRDRGNRGGRGDQQDERQAGPIVGVRSLVDKSAIIPFNGGQRYSEWRFTAELINMPAGLAGMENVPRLYSRWIGRSLPPGLELPDLDTDLDQPAEPTRQRRPRGRSRNRGGGPDDGR